jgi:hypothetical protein
LNGRNALQLIALLPGVVNAGTGGQFGATQSTFSTSGGRNIDMNFTLDGGYNMNSSYSIANEYPNPMRCRSSRQPPATIPRVSAEAHPRSPR